jgi:hypothetical protein
MSRNAVAAAAILLEYRVWQSGRRERVYRNCGGDLGLRRKSPVIGAFWAFEALDR